MAIFTSIDPKKFSLMTESYVKAADRFVWMFVIK